jgi:hypothetical protein
MLLAAAELQSRAVGQAGWAAAAAAAVRTY